MDTLLDPNVAYLLLASGMLLAILAVLSPGSGILEIGAIFTLLLAAYGIYNLPVNLWALAILLLGVFPFLLAVRRSGRLAFLGISIAALVVGSAFLFRSQNWWIPAVNPLLALAVSALYGGFSWVATRKVLEAESQRPSHDLEGLIGAVGEAKTDIHEQGSVQIEGELWSARSEKPIPNGSQVKVRSREGFILEVEATNHAAP